MFILRIFKTINLVCKHFCNRNACKIKLEKAIVSYLLLSSKISRNMFLIPSPLLPWFFWRIKEVQRYTEEYSCQCRPVSGYTPDPVVATFQ